MKQLKKFSKYRDVILIIADCICVIISYYFGVAVITDSFFDIGNYYKTRLLNSFVGFIIIYEILFHITKKNKNIIRYEEGNDYLKYVILCFCTAILLSLMAKIFIFFRNMKQYIIYYYKSNK